MALGGEFSVSRDGKTLKESESSLDKLTEVGNQVAFNRNNIDDIPLIQEARRHGARIDIYPTGFDEDVSQNTYYQPMKFSGIAYLATAGAVKNGMANVNPGRLFKNGYNPNIQALEDSDRIIYHLTTIMVMQLRTLLIRDLKKDKLVKTISEKPQRSINNSY